MKRIVLSVLSVLSLSLATTSQAKEPPPPTLLTVMQDLELALVDLHKSILREDYPKIGEAAMKIAKHPKPLGELPVVVKTLGKRMPAFKKFDGIVHRSAAEIGALAKSKDMPKILAKTALIVENCSGCHTSFRSEVSSVLAKHRKR